jgi:hypothetical protein
MLIALESILTLLTLLLAWRAPRFANSTFTRVESAFSKLAHRRALAITIVGLAAILARVAVLPVLPAAHPHTTDEFSQLLLADTLLHHRVTNPTPPLWIHFETFQENMRPTYHSMYPPAPAIFFALGRLLTHSAFTGVVLTLGIMCAALCWMFYGWLSPEWALAGGFLAVMRLAIFSYFGATYWGAPVGVAGGALVLGALPRILGWTAADHADFTSDSPSSSTSQIAAPASAVPPTTAFYASAFIFLAIGLILLANSRPYEGFIFSIPACLAVLPWLARQLKFSGPLRTAKIVAPALIILILAGTAMCFYFRGTTGNPFLMPQQLNRDTYAEAPYFLWQSARAIEPYHHAVFKRLYTDFEMGVYTETRSLGGMIALAVVHLASFWTFYLGVILTLPMLLALTTVPVGRSWSRISPRAHFLIIESIVCAAGLSVEVFFAPHYAAPITGLVLLFVLFSLARVRNKPWLNSAAGAFIARGLFAVVVLVLAARTLAAPLHVSISDGLWSWNNAVVYPTPRLDVIHTLDAKPGNHLVIVRFDPRNPLREDLNWIYNRADIDSSRIIWAWDMGPANNQQLIEAYPGREVWLLQPDAPSAPRLSPYQSN